MGWIEQISDRFRNSRVLKSSKTFTQDRCPIDFSSIPDPSAVLDADALLARVEEVENIVDRNPYCDLIAVCESNEQPTTIFVEAKTDRTHTNARVREAISQLSWSFDHFTGISAICPTLPIPASVSPWSPSLELTTTFCVALPSKSKLESSADNTVHESSTFEPATTSGKQSRTTALNPDPTDAPRPLPNHHAPPRLHPTPSRHHHQLPDARSNSRTIDYYHVASPQPSPQPPNQPAWLAPTRTPVREVSPNPNCVPRLLAVGVIGQINRAPAPHRRYRLTRLRSRLLDSASRLC